MALDLSKLDARRVHIRGSRVEVALPPLQAQVELRPAETEVISSNLDSAQTAQLLELARIAFEREVMADPALQAKARGSTERALTGLLLSLGFREVDFVDALSPGPGSSPGAGRNPSRGGRRRALGQGGRSRPGEAAASRRRGDPLQRPVRVEDEAPGDSLGARLHRLEERDGQGIQERRHQRQLAAGE